jgi:3-hydroxymyristoyl/3-hydroxydecanoyl-(acyl carrier protein) dehydratase
MRCLLIDKITCWEHGRSITGIKNVTMSESFLRDHFPGFPVMPGVLQLEAAAQLGSWLVFASTDYTHRARLLGVQSIKFKEFIVPGDQMVISLEFKTQDNTQAVFNARILVDDRLKTDIRQGRLVYRAVETLEDPLGARQHFAFITGQAPRGGYAPGKGNRF